MQVIIKGFHLGLQVIDKLLSNCAKKLFFKTFPTIESRKYLNMSFDKLILPFTETVQAGKKTLFLPLAGGCYSTLPLSCSLGLP